MQKFYDEGDALSVRLMNRKNWRRIVVVLAAIVVFCTVYMLVLPAMTMERETYCGLQEHDHGDGCYETVNILMCGYPVENTTTDIVAAQPDETMWEEATSEEAYFEQIPTDESSEEYSSEETETESTTSVQNEPETHLHTEECYESDVKLVCTLSEHTHEDDCFLNDETATNENVMQDEDYNISFFGDTDEYDTDLLADAQNPITRVDFDKLDGSGETYYVVYTSYNGNYYAMDGNGTPVAVTVSSDGTVTSSSLSNNLYWSFSLQSGSTYIIQNLGTSRYMHSYYNSSTNYGVTTSGAYSSSLETTGSGSDKVFKVKSNSNYSVIGTSGSNVVFSATASNDTDASSKAAQFYLAEVFIPQDTYHVWFDGTCGGIMSLYEADNTYQAVPGTDPTIVLPTTCKSPSKYDYTLNGWYDIKNHKYYKPGEEVTVTKNTVFYADWVAATYDIGQNNEHVVSSLDTDSFIRTDMFDYSAVFNFNAVTHSGSVSASSHDETWTVVQNDNVPYMNNPSLGFIFRDWDSGNKHISYASNRARLNDNQGKEITSEIIDYVYDMSGENIIDILFNPETQVIGKNYVGKANYLYQFMEEGSSNYDGTHNGYYYYDATLNAASYNQTEERFYIYDYLERTSDSLKDGFDSSGNSTAAGSYSDFLPFNSPYVNNSNNKTIVDYADKNGETGNYQYDAKATDQGSAAGNAGTNYWFGMKSEIQFYLPNDTGIVDEYGNYGNISTHGEHMNFQFHGDDDLWVFIDGELVMDVGGLHGIMNGTIDFSTGTVTTGYAENNSLTATPTESVIDIKEGDHTLTIYYMERGGSQSNCAIYFNIAPRYGMEIIKQDALSAERLNGAEFSVYTDENCSVPAELWNSESDYENEEPGINVFTAVNGRAYFWGISAGKVYYIKETKAPDGYPETDDIVRVAMNNLGGAVCTTDSLRGENEEHTEGFDVFESDADEAIQVLSVVLTNRKETTEDTETTNLRVSKKWADGSENIPDSITVYLLANGVVVGKAAALNDSNGWTYTWTGLPLTDDDGEINYTMREVQVPGFVTEQSTPEPFTDNGEWMKTDSLRDGDTFLIVNSETDQALSVSNGVFVWISRDAAQSNASAQWTSIADGMGFRLQNGSNYNIVLDGTSEFVPAQEGNRILYFYNSKLFAQSENIYYYFGSNAAADSESGLEFELYKESTSGLSGVITEITNTPIPELEQTYLTVEKVWSDGEAEHINDSITVRLFSDGTDTGRTLTLNRNNGWTGTFDGLPYILDGSDELISYTVVEDVFAGYFPDYSDIVIIPGEPIVEWITATALEADKIYRFTSGGYALSSNSSNAVISATDNPDDTYQQWRVVEYNGNLKLQNVGNSRYLYYNRSLTTNTSYTNNYANVSLSDNKLRIGNNSNRYITLSSSAVSTTTSTSSATTLTLTTPTTTAGTPGYIITVSNVESMYILPETGGIGEYSYMIYGMLAVLVSTGTLYAISKRKKDYNK